METCVFEISGRCKCLTQLFPKYQEYNTFMLWIKHEMNKLGLYNEQIHVHFVKHLPDSITHRSFKQNVKTKQTKKPI